MTDTISMFDFHFLRPWWLLVIPPAIYLFVRLRRAFSIADQWRGAIAEHLITHLGVGSAGRKLIRPYQLMVVALVVGSVAMAGPDLGT